MTRKPTRWWLALLILCGAASGLAQAADVPGANPELRDVKVEQRPGGLTVTLTTTTPPKYETRVLESPFRLVIDVNGSFGASRSRWASLPEPITEIRGSQFKPGTAR